MLQPRLCECVRVVEVRLLALEEQLLEGWWYGGELLKTSLEEGDSVGRKKREAMLCAAMRDDKFYWFQDGVHSER